METIPEEMLRKYHMEPIEGYFERHGDSIDTKIGFYQTFLIQTDYIVSKISELKLNGEDVSADYVDVLTERKMARAAIDELKAELPT